MGDANFCASNTEVITDQNYGATYTGAYSSLPGGGAGWQTTDATTGLADQSAVDTWVSSLIATAQANAPGGIGPDDIAGANPAAMFATKASALRTSINKEYCFYYKRYMYGLQKVLMLSATSGLALSGNSTFTQQKDKVKALNSKLNQILQVMQSLVASRTKSMKNYYGSDTGVNQINKDLDSSRERLKKHMLLLENGATSQDVRAAMIDYTLEKNSSSRNLLAVYGFMNIVAVGLLFYLYRSQA
jgi:hypothetical protein